MVTSPEKVVLPGGGDLYDYVEEMRKKAASQRTIVPVADITEADTIATAMAAEGRPVTDANPLVVRDLSIGEINVKNASGWLNTPWATLTLLGTWVAYVGGGGYYSGLKYRKKDGMVLVHGMIKSGAAASNIAQLPAGFYPNYTSIHTLEANGAGTLSTVLVSNSDGMIAYRSGPAAPGYLSVNLSLPLF
ncbi:hypothetical protein SEA_OTTAWA_47 [Arthrobacter phage Ottawa]|nr:minor tail protein [Arthrobacter phage Kharcho]WIC89279.1 hypothetical protein SEA_OTTAWA_47 [Arthrobacter phage Ottawa]